MMLCVAHSHILYAQSMAMPIVLYLVALVRYSFERFSQDMPNLRA